MRLLIATEISPAQIEAAINLNARSGIEAYRKYIVPRNNSTRYNYLFGFRGNMIKFIGHEGRRAQFPVRHEHVVAICQVVRAFGYECPDPRSENDWRRAVMTAIHAIRANKRGQEASQHELLRHPAWRLVPRPELIGRTLQQLHNFGAVAIVGMSGSGKSILASQVAKTAAAQGSQVYYMDCREYFDRGAGLVGSAEIDHYTPIWLRLFKQLLEMKGAGPKDRDSRLAFGQAIRDFAVEWSPFRRSLSSGERDLLEVIETDLPGQRAAAAWERLGRGFGEALPALKTAHFVRNIAKLVRPGVTSALIVLDDVLNISAAKEPIQILFGAAPIAGAPRLQLLITSRRRGDDLGFLVGNAVAEAFSRNFDQYDPDFAGRVVAAWSTPGTDDLTAQAATERITAFRKDRLDRDERVWAAAVQVIEYVEGHALALAALASAWRDWGWRAGFWKDALKSLMRAPDDILHLSKTKDHDDIIEDRHQHVLQSLQFTSELRGDDPDWLSTFDRFLDLAAVGRGQVIPERVFLHLWQRVPRGPGAEVIAPALAAERSPLRLLAAASFVRAGDAEGEYKLHDMHRVLIDWELRDPARRAKRFRGFLKAFGLTGVRGDLRIDRAAHFRTDQDRTILWLELDGAAPDGDKREAGRFLLSRLSVLVVGAYPKKPRMLERLCTEFRYLQARLDMPIFYSKQRPKSGNVESLRSALPDVGSGVTRQIRRVVSRSGLGLAEDRHQLAAQLEARLPRTQDFEHLVRAASSYRTVPTIRPLWAFLEDNDHEYSSLPGTGSEKSGAVVVIDTPRELTVLAWARDELYLWHPNEGQLRHMPAWDRINKAIWVSGAKNGPNVLAYSDGAVALYDIYEGTGRGRYNRPDEKAAVHATWLSDPQYGDALLVWVSEQPQVHVYDAESGRNRFRFLHSEEFGPADRQFGVQAIPHSTGGARILTWSSADNTVALWSAGNGELIVRYIAAAALSGARLERDWLDGETTIAWSSTGDIWLYRGYAADPFHHMKIEANYDDHGGSDAWAASLFWKRGADGHNYFLYATPLSRHAYVLSEKAEYLEKIINLGENVHSVQIIETPRSTMDLLVVRRDGVAAFSAYQAGCEMSVRLAPSSWRASWVAEAWSSPAIITWDGSRFADIWEAHDGTKLAEFMHTDEIGGLSWVENTSFGEAILAWSKDSLGAGIRISKVVAGQRRPANAHERGSDAIYKIRWASRSPRPLVLSWSDNGLAQLHDASAGAICARKRVSNGELRDGFIAMINDKSAIGVLWTSRSVHLFGHDQFDHVFTISEKQGSITDVQWIDTCGGNGSARLMMVMRDGLIRCIDPKTGNLRVIVEGAFADGALWLQDLNGISAILSWSLRAGIALWDANSGARIGKGLPSARASEVRFARTGTSDLVLLAWDHGKSELEIWDMAAGSRTARFSLGGPVNGAEWVCGGDLGWLVLTTSADKCVRLWSQDGEDMARLDMEDDHPHVLWTRQENGTIRVLAWSVGMRAYVWDPSADRAVATLSASDIVLDAAWITSGSGRQLIGTAHRDGMIGVWDPVTGHLLRRFDCDAPVNCLVAEPCPKGDAVKIACGCDDGALVLLEIDLINTC